MKTYHIIRCMSLVASLTIGLAPIAWLAALPTQAAAPPSGELVPSVSPEGIDSIAPGAASHLRHVSPRHCESTSS